MEFIKENEEDGLKEVSRAHLLKIKDRKGQILSKFPALMQMKCSPKLREKTVPSDLHDCLPQG